MHERLARQIGNATAADGTLDLERLLRDVGQAYADHDRERELGRDVIGRARAELDTLRRSIRDEAENRFNIVMDNVGEAVVTVALDGTILSFNRAAEDMFGYTAAGMVGGDVALLTTPERAARLRVTLADYARTGDPGPLAHMREGEGVRHDGDVFPIEMTLAGVSLDGQQQLVGVIRDTSVQVETERQLRESEGRFRDLVGSASDWFWETDADHHLTFVSERIAAVLGVKSSAIVGNTFFDLGLADDAVAAEEHRAELAERRPFRDRVFHVGPPEGHDSRVIRISGIPVFNDLGDFSGYRGVGVDVTREVQAERRAHKAQQLLADAIERIVDGLAIYDAQDRLVLFNPEYTKVFAGLAQEMRPGIRFEDLLRSNPKVFDTEGKPFEHWVEQRLAHHRAASGQPFVVRLVSGRWILHREFRMADGGVVGLRTDITELKQREQELESLRRLYRVILDTAGEGIVGLDAEGRVTFANRRAGELLGHGAEGMVGHDFHQLAQPVDPDGNPWQAEDTTIGRVRALGTLAEVSEDSFRRADNSVMPVDYEISAIHEDGRVTGAVVVFRDATLRLRYERTLADSHRELERLVAERTRELTSEVESRARTERALRDSRERLKSISDSLFEGVLVINRNGLLTFANPSARALLDLDDEPEGLPLDSVLSVRRRGAIVAAPWASVLAGEGNFLDNDAVFVTPGGKAVEVAYACSAVCGDGEVRAVVVSFRDISPLKAAEREALQSSRMASVGQLAAGIAHEINTPIQYIGDNLRFIADSMADIAAAVSAGRENGNPEFTQALDQYDVAYLLDEVPRAVSQSLDGVAQVARIVLSMKEFSHPGSTNKTMADINRALDSTITVSRNTWKHVATITTDFTADLPSVPCYAGELNQVFLNIIVNAAHAIESAHRGDDGVIHVTTRAQDGFVAVTISDNGTGIPESVRDKIFDPFFTTKEVGKGTGQGLAISRDVVVVKHGGRIEVDSRDGEGASFTIWLPLAPGDDTLPDQPEGE